MRESVRKIATRHLVATALAGVLAAGLHVVLPDTRVQARDDLVGPATIVDGDTIAIAGVRVRLEGIDAPETGQTCGTADAGQWPCGLVASRALVALVEGQSIACQRRGVDKYRRILAICFREGADINAEMVRTGHAWAFVRYSQIYVALEAEARQARRGIWQGPAEPAWDYRAGRWQTAETLSPHGCAIKGNISRHGSIYHMPWSPWYGKVKIDERRGERWFCSESDAAEAGFRPAHPS